MSDVGQIELNVPSPETNTSPYCKLQPRETFTGGMPILEYNQRVRFIQEAERLYGQSGGGGKWGDILLSENAATKIFRQPDNILAAYEFEFMRMFGGKNGLPEFYGAVPDGYQMEKIEGKTLTSMIDKAVIGLTPEEIPAALKNLLTTEQAQELLNLIADFHKTTRRVHGDLGKFDDVIVTREGKVRLIDPEWERIGNQTPQGELESTYRFLANNLGIEDLKMPETISEEDATRGLSEFKAGVLDRIELNPVFSSRVKRFKDVKVEIKADDNGLWVKPL